MSKPNRIVSLVPSLTELVIDLGLKDRLKGRTRFCIHPGEEVKDIPIVGGTKNPRIDKIIDIEPDYIIANREENRKEDIEQLFDRFHVHLTDISTIEDAIITIHELGNDLKAENKAKEIISEITELLEKRPDEPPQRVGYLIWKNPWMTVGKDTYVHDVLKHWNLVNVFGDMKRYPNIELMDLKKRYPDLILLSSEPYPFSENHIEEVEKICNNTRILTVDGEWFSWYGTRMIPSFKKLNTWRKAIA